MPTVQTGDIIWGSTGPLPVGASYGSADTSGGGVTADVQAFFDFYNQQTPEVQAWLNSPEGRAAGRQPKKPAAVVEDEFNGSLAGTIKNLLSQYGLDELIPNVDAWVRQGLSWQEIEVQLRDPSTAPGKVFDRIFPEVQLRRKAGLVPMSVAQIQSYRQNAREVLRAAGLPEGFYDSAEDMRDLIVNDVSLQELQNRVSEFEDFGAQIAAGAGGELDLFQRAYGITPTAAQLAALVLDPDKALPGLKRQFSAVRLDVASGRAGFGDLSQGEAERLADVGVDPSQAVAGFGQLTDSKQLFDALPGFEGSEDTIGRSDQLSAAFEGNANARRRIERQAQRRKAQFAGGGSFSSSREGFEGIGTAR